MAEGGMIAMGAGGCCCLACIVFVIVFFATGMKTVEQTEWCLKYNWWTESVSPDPITSPGMTFVGMGNYLVRYPNTNKYVYFRDTGGGKEEGDIYKAPIEVRTKDGLSVSLQLDLVYRLQPENLNKLFHLVGEGTDEVPGWHATLVHVAEGVIDNLATLYDAQAYYTNRTQVAKAFEDELRIKLNDKLFITLEQMQMHSSTFPAAYDAKIKETQNQKQQVQVATQERQKEIIDKQGELRQEKELANKILATARGQAQQVAVDNNAHVEQYIYQTSKEAEGYARTLGFFESTGGSTGDFLEYMQVKGLMDHHVGSKQIKLPAVPA